MGNTFKDTQNVLSWTKFKEREKQLQLNDRADDIFRLDISTVPEELRGMLEVYVENKRREKQQNLKFV